MRRHSARRISRWFNGQREVERRSFANTALHPDFSAMSVDDPLGDVEPQTHAEAPARLTLPVTIEYVRQLPLRDTRSGIRYREANLRFARLDVDANLAARGGHLDGVAH